MNRHLKMTLDTAYGTAIATDRQARLNGHPVLRVSQDEWDDFAKEARAYIEHARTNNIDSRDAITRANIDVLEGLMARRGS